MGFNVNFTHPNFFLRYAILQFNGLFLFFSSFFFSFFFFLFLFLSYSMSRYAIILISQPHPQILRIDLRGRFPPGPWLDTSAQYHGRPRGMNPPARSSRRCVDATHAMDERQESATCLYLFPYRSLFLSQRDWIGVRPAMAYRTALFLGSLLLAP